ncbi:A-kinase-interacting protein 1 isoform X2 [Phacochoerus africanus]|uniref:A-kinase-interacting protein 1 isoform X2 n=1 Tax=Phacochoerus africanus TaxID=41426 RepID=UPI001FD880AE|nr:A-kinase-interacting protein 1 isoform X2 [Phacochoerus africanus]
MESCLVAAALNGVDRRSLQRSARLAREVLERARRRAVDWRSVELPKGSVGVISRELPCRETGLAAGPQRLLPGEREERLPTLSASFRTMAEFMDYTSSQCGKYCSSLPEEGGSAHAYRYHRGGRPHVQELLLDCITDGSATQHDSAQRRRPSRLGEVSAMKQESVQKRRLMLPQDLQS